MTNFILLPLFAALLLILAIIFKEYALGVISGMLIMVIGVFMAINGFLGLDNFLTQGIAVLFIGLGFYIFIEGTYEKILEVFS